MTEEIVDLTGVAKSEVRLHPLVSAITSRVRVGELAPGDVPPAVVIRALPVDYNPGGGSRRLRLQEPLFVALCYATTRPAAAQLGNAVAASVNLRGPRIDGSRRLVYLSLVDSGGDVELDPDTKWPFATVLFRMLGAQQAVPV